VVLSASTFINGSLASHFSLPELSRKGLFIAVVPKGSTYLYLIHLSYVLAGCLCENFSLLWLSLETHRSDKQVLHFGRHLADQLIAEEAEIIYHSSPTPNTTPWLHKKSQKASLRRLAILFQKASVKTNSNLIAS
jgi:hypothetical protein